MKNAVRLWWCGDYAEEYDFENEKEFKRIYKYAWDYDDDKEKHTTIPEPNTDFDWSNQWYFVNLSKREFVKMPKQKEEEYEYDWIYNCVPLLTAVGNGRGGGDWWREDMLSVVGYWAGDVVYLTLKKPDDKLFCDITEDADFGKEEL